MPGIASKAGAYRFVVTLCCHRIFGHKKTTRPPVATLVVGVAGQARQTVWPYSAMSFAGLLSTGALGTTVVPTLWSITGGFSSCSTSAV